ncbi:flagellar hook-length control protein [Shewanella denitrificans OS217]|jgi:flagellar hook-length control protein FliK|uniref:Flagellar hook-length control protein n=1 Tax=Shewanella denitrificans (strain OS217 / ATCC BAA-1090 / DSM 15013) TaxID=318161 RepID=Q12I16_SHEDO|nr:flagellar hook-length control protein FliK [Shewanella denitrificans]ABE56910.1 flagellar hook-length control protein [Shewanella denitrificans OS217]
MISDVLGSRSLTTELGLQSNNKPQGKPSAEQGAFASFANDRANEAKRASVSKPQTGNVEAQEPQSMELESSTQAPLAAAPQTAAQLSTTQMPVWTQAAMASATSLDGQTLATVTGFGTKTAADFNTQVQTVAQSTTQAMAQTVAQSSTQNSIQASVLAMPINADMLTRMPSKKSSSMQALHPQSGLAAVMGHSVSAGAQTERSGITFSDALMPSPAVSTGATSITSLAADKRFAEQRWSNGIGATAKESSILTTVAQGLAPQTIGSTVLADSSDNQTQLFTQMLARGGTAPSVSQWGPVPVNMAGSLSQQAQDMLTPLREQLRFQIDQQIKHAEIRLDPPELGKLELNIRLDGDKLQVQMHAANPAVREALLSGLDRLRADLAQEYGGSLDVDVGHNGASDKQNPQQHEGRMLASQVENFELPQARQTSSDNQLNLLA